MKTNTTTIHPYSIKRFRNPNRIRLFLYDLKLCGICMTLTSAVHICKYVTTYVRTDATKNKRRFSEQYSFVSANKKYVKLKTTNLQIRRHICATIPVENLQTWKDKKITHICKHVRINFVHIYMHVCRYVLRVCKRFHFADIARHIYNYIILYNYYYIL